MKLLIINSGSSSIKYQLLSMENETVLASGLVERIGEAMGIVKNTLYPDTAKELKVTLEEPIPDHRQGMLLVVSLLCDKEKGIIADKKEITGIGHRVVHGGEDFHQSTLITPEVIEALKKNIPLAPLHNPANLDGIRVAMELFPDAVQVGVFDTAFHQTMPPQAYLYALPHELYEKDRIRRYGFHGTSHAFVAGECARMLDKPLGECNLVTVHLGNGSSITAIDKGRSVDTSMGMTPLEGLVMGTRCGDLDPAIHLFLHKNKGMDLSAIDTLLNKASGLKGLCGMNDLRDIHKAVDEGDKRAQQALDALCYRNRKYIASYMAILGHVDAIVFTAGIGENDPIVRAESLRGMEFFGVHIDTVKNNQRSREARRISTDASKVQLFVIPTNEELAIARETARLISRN